LTDLNADIPARLSSIAAWSPAEQTRSYGFERTQQSPASRLPSLEHLINTNPPHHSSYNFSSGRCDGPHTTNNGSVATRGTAYQRSSNFVPPSLQRTPTDIVYGSLSGQHLQNARQSGVPANQQEGEGTPQSINVSAAEISDLASNSVSTAGTGNTVPWSSASGDTIPWFSEADDTIPWFPEADDTIPWFPEADDTIPWFPEANDTLIRLGVSS